MYVRGKFSFAVLKKIGLIESFAQAISTTVQLITSAALVTQVSGTDSKSNQLLIDYLLKPEIVNQHIAVLPYLDHDPLPGLRQRVEYADRGQESELWRPVSSISTQLPSNLSQNFYSSEGKDYSRSSGAYYQDGGGTSYSGRGSVGGLPGSRSSLLGRNTKSVQNIIEKREPTSQSDSNTFVEGGVGAAAVPVNIATMSDSLSGKTSGGGGASGSGGSGGSGGSSSNPLQVSSDFFQRDVGNAMVIQSDDSIFVAGNVGPSQKDLLLVKYRPDGTLDPTFGAGNGYVTTAVGNQATGYAVVLQSDNKILLGASAFIPGNQENFILARYLTDGNLDSAWGSGGLVQTDFSGFADEILAIVLQSDGKVLVTGYASGNGANNSHVAVARYLTNGSLDTSFAGTGKAQFNLGGKSLGTTIVLQSDGKIVIGGQVKTSGQWDPFIIRLTSAGVLDATFAASGVYTFDMGGDERVNTVKLTSTGEILFAGYSTNANADILVGKLDASGALNSAFGSGGLFIHDIQSTDDQVTSMLLQSDGSMIITGSVQASDTDVYAIKVLSNGTVDSSFAQAGLYTVHIHGDDVPSAIAINSSNDFILSGTSSFNGASDSDLFIYQIP